MDFDEQRKRGKRYPVVVNLHGGGFTLSTPTDDARWARMVLHELDAIFPIVALSNWIERLVQSNCYMGFTNCFIHRRCSNDSK